MCKYYSANHDDVKRDSTKILLGPADIISCIKLAKGDFSAALLHINDKNRIKNKINNDKEGKNITIKR